MNFLLLNTKQKKNILHLKKKTDVELIHNKNNIETYRTKYGLVSLYSNEKFIGKTFKNGNYWDEGTLTDLKKYINPNRNIIEIGGHCGTSSLVYSTFIRPINKLFVFEPQKSMFQLLFRNILQNNLQKKIIPYNLGIFCYNGLGKMNNIDLDGGGGIIEKRYGEEKHLDCNFGGVGLGSDGENIQLVTLDSMNFNNIGFIHCDAQGAENFIFSKGIETIKRCRPVILYENNKEYGKYLYNSVCKSYPEYIDESNFDIKKYCLETLKYSKVIDRFNGSIDTLLLP